MSMIINCNFIFIFRDDVDKVHKCCGEGCSMCPAKKALIETGGCSVVDIASGRSISVYTEVRNGKSYIYAGWRNGAKNKRLYLGKKGSVDGLVLEEKLTGAFHPC